MKMHNLENESLPMGILAQHSLSAVVKLVKELFTGAAGQEIKISYWQLIFSQSKANGCSHHFEDFPQARWQWPKDTWFQERLSRKLGEAGLAAHL